jgi:hypothetical protein
VSPVPSPRSPAGSYPAEAHRPEGPSIIKVAA